MCVCGGKRGGGESNHIGCLCTNVVLVVITFPPTTVCSNHTCTHLPFLALFAPPSCCSMCAFTIEEARSRVTNRSQISTVLDAPVSVSVPCEKTDVSLYETSCILLLRSELVDLRFMASSGTVE